MAGVLWSSRASCIAVLPLIVLACHSGTPSTSPRNIPKVLGLSATTESGYVELHWQPVTTDPEDSYTYTVWRSSPVTEPFNTTGTRGYEVRSWPDPEMLAQIPTTLFVDGTATADTVFAYFIHAVRDWENGPASDTLVLHTPPAVAPQASWLAGPAPLTSQTRTIFEFTGEHTREFLCQLDDQPPVSCASPWQVYAAEGTHGTHLWAVGRHGLIQTEAAVWRWTVDTTPPEVQILEYPAATVTESTVMIEFAGQDNRSTMDQLTYMCQVDGEPFLVCDSPLALSGLSEGYHTLKIQAMDAVGLRSGFAALTWQLDLPPETYLGYRPADPNPLTDAVFSLRSDDPYLAGFACTVDGVAIPCDDSFSLSPIAGSHSLSAIAHDANGNVDPSPLTYSWETTTSITGAHAVTLAVGDEHVCGLTESGKLWCLGTNDFGQAGPSAPAPLGAPQWVTTTEGWTSITTGRYHSCGIQAGRLYCWGWNILGQLGTGGTPDQSDIPLRVGSDSDWAGVSAGSWHSCAWRLSGDSYCWGANDLGQLGTGDDVLRAIPTDTGQTFATVQAHGQSSCGLTASGQLQCWGANGAGQLGLGHTLFVDTPTAFAMGSWPTQWNGLAMGSEHTCALSSGGVVWCWGANHSGQTGSGILADRQLEPITISLTSVPQQIRAGGNLTCALPNSGEPLCWGEGLLNQLGNGWNDNSFTPVNSTPDRQWDSLSISSQFACGIHADSLDLAHLVWCWGSTPVGHFAVPHVMAPAP